jgi:uncharacterized protein (TIGR02145 family)
MKKIYFALTLFFYGACSYSQNACPSLPTVNYGGQTYQTVLIGNQCWLKQNINIGTMIPGLQNQTNNGSIEKYCYNDSVLNCTNYGGLYQWNEAMQYAPSDIRVQGICPTSWHIPNNTELSILATSAGGNSNSLKATGQGVDTGSGTNSSGFSALLGGDRISSGVYSGLGKGGDGYFWSSTENDATHSLIMDLSGQDKKIYQYSVGKDNGFSIRCIKDGQLLLKTPNGGENWQIGTVQNITWTSSYIANAKLDFTTNNGTSWTAIIASVPASTGLYNWAIPYSPSTQCRVRISDVSDSTTKSISSNIFTIFGPTLTITSPKGGEDWRAGATDTIKWTSSLVTNAMIELTTNNGTTWTIINASAPASTGLYIWKVPSSTSVNCRVRLTDIALPIVNSTSANVFTISNPPCPGLATVVYGGQTYNTVQIGNQCWLKENLNTGTRINGLQDQVNNGGIEKYCYNNDVTNCNTYGALYQWAEAVQYQNGATNISSPNPAFTGHIQGICPTGWHIPDTSEFNSLIRSVNGEGNALKALGRGTSRGAGTDISGFSALLSGVRYSDGSFNQSGLYDYFLSVTETSTINNYYMDLTTDSSFIFISSAAKYYGRSVRCLYDTPTGIEERNNPDVPEGYLLLQNFPNPFNPTTIISYQVPIDGFISIKIYDALGNEVTKLVNEYKTAGRYEATFNGSNLSSGVYFYQMKSGEFIMTRKLILIK